jgi:hypothetical protein
MIRKSTKHLKKSKKVRSKSRKISRRKKVTLTKKRKHSARRVNKYKSKNFSRKVLKGGLIWKNSKPMGFPQAPSYSAVNPYTGEETINKNFFNPQNVVNRTTARYNNKSGYSKVSQEEEPVYEFTPPSRLNTQLLNEANFPNSNKLGRYMNVKANKEPVYVEMKPVGYKPPVPSWNTKPNKLKKPKEPEYLQTSGLEEKEPIYNVIKNNNNKTARRKAKNELPELPQKEENFYETPVPEYATINNSGYEYVE